jgi:hypothetical protein
MLLKKLFSTVPVQCEYEYSYVTRLPVFSAMCSRMLVPFANLKGGIVCGLLSRHMNCRLSLTSVRTKEILANAEKHACNLIYFK